MKSLIIDLTNQLRLDLPATKILHELPNSINYAKRSNGVTIITNSCTNELKNYITQYKIENINPITLVFQDKVYQGYDQIEYLIAYLKTNQVLNRVSSGLTELAYRLMYEHHVPTEYIHNIDDHIPTELLRAYDITLGMSCVPYSKMNTYKPTDLQRKEWRVSDDDFSFTKNDTIGNRLECTLYDKVIAYITLQYYIGNGLNSVEYNESSTGSITRKHLNYCADVCGHAHPFQTNDDVQDFIDGYRLQFLLYSDNKND